MKRFSGEWFKERFSVSCFNMFFLAAVGAVLLAIMVLACTDSSSALCLLMQSAYRAFTREDPKEIVDQIPTQLVPSATPPPCYPSPSAQLGAKDRAIQMQPGGIRLRSEPNIDYDDNKIGTINKCELVTILEGPKCINGYNFYKVKPDGSREGWAAESDKSRTKYWLIPVLDDKKCNLPPIFAEGATITSDHDTPGHVLKAPLLNATRLNWTIKGGDSVKIIDGPICSETYVWYRVNEGAHLASGWTIEGHGNEYYFDLPETIELFNDETAEAAC